LQLSRPVCRLLGGRGGGGWGGGHYPGPALIYGDSYYCSPALVYSEDYIPAYCQ
jgi:hypothetical protein